MFKRLLLAATMGASTLLITGTVSGAAQASDASVCAPVQHATSTMAQRCEWRGNCYYCWRDGHWERQRCR
jgi:hypothetical protein